MAREQPLSGFSDSRHMGRELPPPPGQRDEEEPADECCRYRTTPTCLANRTSDFCSAKLHRIEVVTFEKTIKFGAVPPG